MPFQNITPVQLGQAAIGIGVTTLYTVPANMRTFLKDLDITNTLGVANTVRVFLVPNAGTAGPANALFYDALVPANSTLQWSGSQILPVGATLQVQAGASGLTITASGGEAT